MDLGGKVIAVTGGGHGIGRALCERLAAEGPATLAVLDLDAGAASEVAGSLADPVHGIGLGVDVSSEEQLVTAIDGIESEFGPIDLWCGNVGVIDLGGVELPDVEWHRMFDINVMPHIWASRALIPRMVARGDGHLLFTASAAGLLTQIGSAPYSVTKHAVVALAEWLAITHGHQGLRVSVLCPQAVRTAMTAPLSGGGVAGVDGMMEPEAVAEAAVAGVREDRFLILPHPEVATYAQRKASDHDRWIGGMQRLQARFGGAGRPADEAGEG